MTTDAKATPLDGCRAGCDAALRMLALGHAWRQEWHTLHGRRIERDRDAVLGLQEALANAKEWNAFGEAVHRLGHEYAAATAAIWQDAGDLCLRTQYESATAWRSWLREYRADWMSAFQTDWLPDLGRLAVVNEASMPWREWMEALELGMTEGVLPDGARPALAQRGNGANPTQEGAHAR